MQQGRGKFLISKMNPMIQDIYFTNKQDLLKCEVYYVQFTVELYRIVYKPIYRIELRMILRQS